MGNGSAERLVRFIFAGNSACYFPLLCVPGDVFVIIVSKIASKLTWMRMQNIKFHSSQKPVKRHSATPNAFSIVPLPLHLHSEVHPFLLNLAGLSGVTVLSVLRHEAIFFFSHCTCGAVQELLKNFACQAKKKTSNTNTPSVDVSRIFAPAIGESSVGLSLYMRNVSN